MTTCLHSQQLALEWIITAQTAQSQCGPGSHSTGMNPRHAAWSQVRPERSFSWWQVTSSLQVPKQKYSPVSQHEPCAVTTNSYMPFFPMEHVAWVIKRVKSTLMVWVCKMMLKAPNNHFCPRSWQTVIQHHAYKTVFMVSIVFPQHSWGSMGGIFQITALCHGQNGHFLSFLPLSCWVGAGKLDWDWNSHLIEDDGKPMGGLSQLGDIVFWDSHVKR